MDKVTDELMDDLSHEWEKWLAKQKNGWIDDWQIDAWASKTQLC